MTDAERIRRALQFIPANDRALWVEVGMAVHSELGNAGRSLWDEWSRQAENYSATAAAAVWRSFKAGKITIASLFARAIAAGYQHDSGYIDPGPEELARREKQRAHRERQQADALALRQKTHAEAAKRAATLISQTTLSEHAYLKEKGLGATLGLVDAEFALLVPMRDYASNALLGVQTIRLIDNQWEKKMLHGQRAKGAVLRLGPRTCPETCFVEGYATGLSVEIALRLLRINAAVMVCFSAQNMVHVAQGINGTRYVFADNDQSETGEKAAQQAGLPYCMADEVGMDANDLHQKFGVMAVAKKLMEVRRRL